MVNAGLHGVADLAAEAVGAQGRRLTGNELAVEPSRAAGLDLILDRQVRAHRDRDALAPGCVFEPPQLDDAARRRVACRIQIGQADMVSAPSTPSITA